MTIFGELKRRNVFRVGALYLVVAWLVLQVTDVAVSLLELPAWAGKLVFLLLAAGFPVALILAWVYELTPEGLVRENEAVAPAQSEKRRPAIDYVIVGALVAALAWFAWQHPWRETTEAGGPSEIRSLVVLPLENLMNDAQQAYFVDGMHDALINELSHISALRVISRTSAERYRDTDLSLPDIAGELGVDAVVEGSVFRAGETVRINVSLIDARDERHLWSEQFDRDLVDILRLYADVTRRIADQVQAQVSDSERAHLASAESVDAERYDRFLRAVALCDRWSAGSMRRGIEQLRALVRSDPDDARPQAALAMCLQYAAFFGYVDGLEVHDEATRAADVAVRLAPELVLAQVARAGVYWYLEFDASTAKSALQQALTINPADTRALIHDAWWMSESGEHERAIRSGRKAVDSDPFNNAAQQALGQALYLVRDFEASLEPLLEAVRLDPGDPSFYVYPAWTYLALDRNEEAIELLQQAVELSGGSAYHLSEYGMALGLTGRRDEAQAVLDRMRALEGDQRAQPFHIAQVEMALGNVGAALDGFEAAYEARNVGLTYIAFGAQYDSLRGEPRFQALVARMTD